MIEDRAMGIIFANMHDAAGGDMTKARSMASLPFGGRYRMIDFYLSGMTACGIQDIVVVTKANYRSLMDHIGAGRPWDLSRKNQGLIIAPPFSVEGGVYHGKIEAIYNNLIHLQRNKSEYVVLSDCDWVFSPDMDKLISAHIDSGADLTMVCCKYPLDAVSAKNCVTVRTSKTGRVAEMRINPDVTGEEMVSMNMFVVSKEKLISLVSEAMSLNRYNFERDILSANLGSLDIRCYEHTGYASRIYNLQSYYRANMDLLYPEVLDSLFRTDRPVRTKIRDEAPVRYGMDSHVKNSVAADGCVIDGTVENSILFRGVTVGRGAVVRNSIIMQGSIVEAGSQLDYVIADKNVRVGQELIIKGVASYPLYIEKGRVLE